MRASDPSHVDTKGLINPRAALIERFMPKRCNHSVQLCFGPLGRHLCDQTHNSGHRSLFQVSFTNWNFRLYQAVRKSRSLAVIEPGRYSRNLWCKPKWNAAHPMRVNGTEERGRA